MNFRISIPYHPPVSVIRSLEFAGRKTITGFILFISTMLFSLPLFSQQTVSGIPLSALYNLPELSSYMTMPAFSQVKKTMKAAQVSDRLKRLEFAHVFELELSPLNSGEWITSPLDEKIWRIGIASAGAFSLNLIFGRFHLLPGVKMFVYSPDHQHVLGAFSSSNNHAAGSLAIEPLPGDSLIVELNIPAHIHHYGQIEVSRVGHDFLNVFGNTFKSTWGSTASGVCNVDINCETGLQWQREKYAVCKLIVNARDICTGTLINNTSGDKTPYVLTANHCIDTTVKAANTVFIFNYEKWKCNGLDGPKPVTFSGSQLIATTPKLDFSLVKLYGLPPFNVRPYFAGWDRSVTPPQKTVTIHHPSGDFKKISIDDDPAVSATFEEDYNPNTHWLINRWEAGTTERGSSGSPLFNQNHHIVGDLTGGDATCTTPVRDYFARLSNSWADFTEPKRQLKAWLDPLNTNVMTLDGMDPYAVERSSCDTFRNFVAGETLRLYNSGLTWGNLSGHNSALISQIAEKIHETGTLKIPGIFLHVAKSHNASNLSFITIKLWKGNTVPEEEITTRSVYLKDLTANAVNFLQFDSIIFISGPVFLGYSLNYSAPQDTFAVYQTQDRGNTGFSGMVVFKDGIWRNISEITSPAIFSSLGIGIVSCSLINSVPGKAAGVLKLHVFPNPVTEGILTVKLPFTEQVSISLWNLTGRQVRADWIQKSDQLEINTSSLQAGTYILRVIVPGKGMFNAKFMVIK